MFTVLFGPAVHPATPRQIALHHAGVSTPGLQTCVPEDTNTGTGLVTRTFSTRRITLDPRAPAPRPFCRVLGAHGGGR